jgi:hypothetical protein
MRLNKKLAEKILGNVNEEHKFSYIDGVTFYNLEDLRIAIDKMKDKAFLDYVNEGENHFSNWVRACVGDARLADGLVGLDRKSALKKIGARIRYIQKYLEKQP